jgi:outer membrane protein W
MRRILLIVLFVQALLVYAQNEEKLTTAELWSDCGLGWEYDFFDADKTMIPKELFLKSLIGFMPKFYSFYNVKNIGFFFQDAIFLQLPLEKQPGDHNPAMQLELSLGAAFRLPLSDKLNLFAGLGGNFNYMWDYAWKTWSQQGTQISDVSEYKLNMSKIGLLCDLGIKIDITEKTYISVGNMFLLSVAIEKAGIYHDYDENAKWHEYREEKNVYGLFRIRPYIAIGTNSWSISKKQGNKTTVESDKGKLKKE